MKAISKDILKTSSKKLMFEMEEIQYDTLLLEFESVLKQINYISLIPGVDDVEPMVFPFDISTDSLREDEPEQPLTQEEALKNSKEVENGQIRLPKVVG